MEAGIQRPVTDNRSEDIFGPQVPAEGAIAQEQILFQQDHPEKLTASPNPYMYPNHQQFQQNPYEQQPPQVIQDGNMLFINGAPEQVVIVNQGDYGTAGVAKRQQTSWTRSDRVGCCCVSVHNDCYCCNIFCMDSFCRCIQHSNMCCYCHNHDCVHCCIHHACRTCCFEKQFCECVLECCKHMPICLLCECLQNAGCGECLCNCIQHCNICDILKDCECGCVGHILEGICGILCCFFK